jgi:hypothetical protein
MSEAKKTWFSDLPAPTSIPTDISVSELGTLMDDPGLTAGKDYIIIDVRRTDLDVSMTMIYSTDGSAVGTVTMCTNRRRMLLATRCTRLP